MEAHGDETDPIVFFRALRGSSNSCSKGFLDSARFQAGEHVLVYG